MKKLLLSIITLTLITTAALAQTPAEILEKYNKITNVDSIDPTVATNVEATIKAQGQTIKFNAVSLGQKVNCTMFIMGQEMKVVSDGKKGWMKIPGQGIIEIPEDQLAAQTQQTNPMDALKFDEKRYTLTVKSDEKYNILTAVAKKGKDKEPKTIYFNKETGLIDQLDVKTAGLNTVTIVSDYKEFDGLLTPTKMTTSVDGKEMAEIIILNFQTNYPAPEFLFTKPE